MVPSQAARDDLGAQVTLAELDADPYPVYRRLRDAEPVAWVPAVGLWFVTRWDDATAVASDPQRFTAAVGASPLERTLGRNVLTVDGDPHRRMRASLGPALRSAAVHRSAPGVVGPIVERLFAGLAGRGEAELMAELFEPVSVLSLATVLGIGEIDADPLRRWFSGLAAGGANFEGDPDKQALADDTSREIDETLAPIVARLEREPDDSILSHMLHADVPDGAPTRAETLSNLKLILLGGMQEPGHGAGNCMYGALSHPDVRARLAGDPALTDQAIEEGLRWLSPVGTSTREVVEAVEVAGVELPAGAHVAAVHASANRDERHWTDPDRLDLDRSEGGHRSFGFGAHFCAGNLLARYEMRIPFRTLFERCPGLRLDPDQPVEVSGWEFRGVKQLPVRWDA
ncbi:MAG TPA: cytochrome P450 [Conexibacter sp.]|nr:cytochrome P450 [Conexibacter sp.]